MNTGGRRAIGMLAASLLALTSIPILAHQVPLQVESFFHVEGTSLRVLARLPLSTLVDVGLPVKSGGTLDVDVAGAKLDAAAADFVRGVEIRDGDRLLPNPVVAWVVSPSNDSAFAAYERAAARLRSATSDEAVDASLGFLDIQLDYALNSADPHLSVRVNGLRAGGRFVPTHATYIPPGGGSSRQFTIFGAPHRLMFEPAPLTAMQMFFRFGAERLVAERKLLMFVFCLMIALPAWSDARRYVSLVLVSYIVAGAAAALVPIAGPSTLQLIAPMCASAALVVAAVQNIAPPRTRWIAGVCILFGLGGGVTAGLAVHDSLSLAGSHALLALAVLLLTVAAGVAGLSPLFRYVCEWLRQLPVPSTPTAAMTAVLSLVPVHMALHSIADELQAVNDAAATGLTSSWLFHMHFWPPVLAAFGLFWLVAVTRLLSGGNHAAHAAR